IRIIPTSALQFFFFEKFKSLLGGHNRAENPMRHRTAASALHYRTVLQRLLAGGLAGICAATLTYPLDMVRCRLTIQLDQTYTGITDAFRSIVRNGKPCTAVISDATGTDILFRCVSCRVIASIRGCECVVSW